MQKEGQEILTIHSSKDAEQPFFWSAGRYRSRFLVEIRDHKRFFGIRCPKCKKVFVPPKQVCGPCFTVMDEPVEVGPQGEVITFTILRFSFVDPATGTTKPVPYAFGSIRLDGADTVLSHYIEYQDESRVQIGARVEAVFEEERTGSIMDIKGFRLLE